MKSKAPKRAKSTKSHQKTGKKVLFEYYAPLAKKVSVAGTFNGWDTSRHKMKKDAKGKWILSMPLPPGRYEYRYFMDNVWQSDQRPVECIPNAFGTWNCVVEVG